MSDERSQSGGKRPRPKRGGKPKTAPAKSKTEAAESKTGAAAKTVPPEVAQRAKAVSLPAYGLAADVLERRSGERGADDRDGDGTGAFDVRLSDPERIFSFADRLAARGDAEAAPEVPTRITTWVTFTLAGEVFALPVEPVREVLRVTSITRVPHAPAPIRGVSNVRGRVIPVIDLRLRIGLDAADLDRSSRVVVVRSRGRLLGLLVDAVHQVAHIDLNRVQQPPEDVMTVQSDYISGVVHLDEQLVLLLDVERALLLREAAEGSPAPPPEGAGSGSRDARRSSPGAV